MNNIVLSANEVDQMLKGGEVLAWASKVVKKEELNEKELAFSAYAEDLIQNMDRYGSEQAKSMFAGLIIDTIEPEVFGYPNEILREILDEGSLGEFDAVRIYNSPKNTLVAKKSAPRTGNVDRSGIDFTRGTMTQEHLQIEFDLKLSDLRRNGAFQLATYMMFALEEFNKAKFLALFEMIDDLLATGSHSISAASAKVTESSIEELTAKVDDNCFDGTGLIIGLSNNMRDASRAIGSKEGYEVSSSKMKDQLNEVGILPVHNNCKFVSIKAGKKTGDGKHIFPEKTVLGIGGKVGKMYSIGAMRSYTTTDSNNETIHVKLTGVEFGLFIDDSKLDKIWKITLQ